MINNFCHEYNLEKIQISIKCSPRDRKPCVCSLWVSVFPQAGLDWRLNKPFSLVLQFYLSLYSWFYMPKAVHKMLAHAHQVIRIKAVSRYLNTEEITTQENAHDCKQIMISCYGCYAVKIQKCQTWERVTLKTEDHLHFQKKQNC